MTDDDRVNRFHCFDFLNHDELVAVAIRKGIIDEDFYRQWMRVALVQDWDASSDLIRLARGAGRDEEAYRAFEALALRWGGTSLP